MRSIVKMGNNYSIYHQIKPGENILEKDPNKQALIERFKTKEKEIETTCILSPKKIGVNPKHIKP